MKPPIQPSAGDEYSIEERTKTMELQSLPENFPAVGGVNLGKTSDASGLAPITALGNSASLDQWRGLALALVLISHAFYYTGRVHGIGRVGVNLFFFISGILVFRSLSKGRGARKWAVSGEFWKRRLIRLYPALVTYVLAVIPLAFLFQHRPALPPNSDFPHFLMALPFALSYLMNYASSSPAVAHLWSVSCEMQFYLLAPLIFFLGGCSPSRRNIVWGALLVLMVISGLSQPLFGDGKKYHFEFAVWPMMLGFCCEYHRAWLERISRKWSHPLILIGLVMLAVSLLLMPLGLTMKKVVIVAGTFVFVPCFLSYVSAQAMPGLAGRWLGWMGERTYSIYLWQQPLNKSRAPLRAWWL